MKKLVVAAPCDCADIVVKKLISLRCVDIRDFSCEEGADLLQKKNYDEQIAALNGKIQKIEGVLSALSKIAKKKRGLGETRARVDREGFVASGERDAVMATVETVYAKLMNDEASDIREFACELVRIETLYDIEKTNLSALEIMQKSSSSDSCIFIVGWMPKKAQERVESALSEYVCAYETEEPTEADEPPVRLSNNFMTRSFEWLVSEVGYPKYRSFDPTLILSVFYFLVFGLMLHDVGYGLILTILGFAGALVTGMRGRTRAIFNTLGFCGISSVIFGVLLGGWFGNMPYFIMQNLLGVQNAAEAAPFFNGVWFKPISQPITYLIVSLAFGAVQILVGMIIKFITLCREGRALDAIFDVLSWWVVFAGIAITLTVNMIAGLVTVGVGALVIVATHGRDKKKASARLGKGLLGLCKIFAFALDLLSYLKVFAVGVSVGIITHFVNMLGTLIGPTPLGYTVFALVSLVGHAICLGAGTLAAFVFAKRFQQVEFLKYFYSGGGEKFSPVQPSDRFTLEFKKK